MQAQQAQAAHLLEVKLAAAVQAVRDDLRRQITAEAREGARRENLCQRLEARVAAGEGERPAFERRVGALEGKTLAVTEEVHSHARCFKSIETQLAECRSQLETNLRSCQAGLEQRLAKWAPAAPAAPTSAPAPASHQSRQLEALEASVWESEDKHSEACLALDELRQQIQELKERDVAASSPASSLVFTPRLGGPDLAEVRRSLGELSDRMEREVSAAESLSRRLASQEQRLSAEEERLQRLRSAVDSGEARGQQHAAHLPSQAEVAKQVEQLVECIRSMTEAQRGGGEKVRVLAGRLDDILSLIHI